jgi:hypothetical protein
LDREREDQILKSARPVKGFGEGYLTATSGSKTGGGVES